MRPARRRLLLALAASPWLARAAEPKPRVAVLASSTAAGFRTRAEVLRKSLGSGVILEFHYADGKRERLEELAKKIVAAAPAVVVASSSLTTRPLRQATATIPIVMASADDPVADRFVKDPAHPGGNITGLTTGRRDEIITAVSHLSAAMPAGAVLGALLDQANVEYRPLRSRLHFAAQQEKRELVYLDASTPKDIDAAFASLGAQKVGGLVVMSDPLYLDERDRLVRLARKARIPVMFCDRAFITAGARLAYGGDSDEDMVRAAIFVRKILDGAHPADLPLEPPAEFRLVKK